MSLRPEIFVSATVPELNPFRKVVKQALLGMGAHAVEHLNFAIEYASLHGALVEVMKRCEAVIHLIGFDYGREPGERTLHAPRRSYAQYELDVARHLEMPLYLFALAEPMPKAPTEWEPEELRAMQQRHRDALRRGETPVTLFRTTDELTEHIRALRSRLIVRRSLARLPARPMGAHFVGRDRVLRDLMNELEGGKVDMLHPHGGTAFESGQGKTCLAIELGWRAYDERRFPFVFWIPAGPQAELEVSLAALARADSLALLPDEVASHRARLQAVLEWFADPQHAGQWLMIIDGVDDEIAWWSLRPILPRLQLGAILVTGRHEAWPGARGHALGVFSFEQARELFAERLIAPVVPAERQAWDRLAEALGRLPLAVEVAAAFLRETKQTARGFLAAWEAAAKTPALAHGPSASAMIEHAVAKLEPGAAFLLKTLSCFDAQPAAIPTAVFEHRGDWPQTQAALLVLARRALLLHDEAGQTVAVHPFIREVVRDRLPADELARALGAARAELDALLQRPLPGVHGTAVREKLLPHCRALLGQLLGHPLELHASPIAQALGEWLKNNGRLLEAETFYRRALAIEEKRLGPDHADLAPRLRDLVTVLRSAHHLTEAEEICRRLLVLEERTHPQDLPVLAADLAHYAATLRAANRLAEAEDLSRQALELTRQSAGTHAAKMATAWHHLAGILEAAHRPREAEPLYRRALTAEERAFGPSHPRLVTRLLHLAWALATIGKRPEAEVLFRRGLELDEAKLGAGHLELAAPLEGLAAVLEDNGDLSGAEALYRRALALLEAGVGPEHPAVAMTQTNLAGVLEAQGQLDAAAELYERAAVILSQQTRRWRGPHPQLKSALCNLRRSLETVGVDPQDIAARLVALQAPVPKRVRSRFLDDWDEATEIEAIVAGNLSRRDNEN